MLKYMIRYMSFKEGEFDMQKIKNKAEYDDLIAKIGECLEWYERKGIEINDYNSQSERRKLQIIYNLTLDNGDKLKLAFGHNNIAHLLGVDTEYLKTTGLFKGDSYSILKEVCSDSYRLYTMVKDGHMTYDNFISDFAYEKVKGFRSICGIDLYNIEFICKYSKDNSYITGYQQLEGDYYIAYKTDGGLFIVGFKKNGNYCYPITNRYIDVNDEHLMEFLKTLLTNQIITMPTMSNLYFANTKSYSKTIYVDYIKKAQIIRTLMQYNQKYNVYVDVSSGYSFVLEKLLKKFNDSSYVYPILNRMFKAITNRVLIDVKELEREFGILPDDMKAIIDIYNSSLNKDINAALDEHTKMVISERDRLSAENQRHINELEKLKRQLLEAQTLISQLRTENDEYRERESSIKRILSMKEDLQ